METPFLHAPTVRVGIRADLVQYLRQQRPIRCGLEVLSTPGSAGFFRVSARGTYGIPGSARMKLSVSMIQAMIVIASSESITRLPRPYVRISIPRDHEKKEERTVHHHGVFPRAEGIRPP